MRPLALIIEVFAGWLGFLGVGHVLVGITEEAWPRAITGMIFMVGWWIVVFILIAISVGTLGAGLACAVPIWFIVPILSAISILYKEK
jgi:hypothetical protein